MQEEIEFRAEEKRQAVQMQAQELAAHQVRVPLGSRFEPCVHLSRIEPTSRITSDLFQNCVLWDASQRYIEIDSGSKESPIK